MTQDEAQETLKGCGGCLLTLLILGGGGALVFFFCTQILYGILCVGGAIVALFCLYLPQIVTGIIVISVVIWLLYVIGRACGIGGK